jgi:hypothetical protein
MSGWQARRGSAIEFQHAFHAVRVGPLATVWLVCAAVAPVSGQILSAGVDDAPGFHAPADSRWKAITVQDVNAAYQLLYENHPGAAPAARDDSFIQRLQQGHARALERARTVDSYEGYSAVLAGFATGMGDKHIWSRPTFVVNMPKWPGLIISKRGNAWIVSDTEPAQEAFLGASLISCDGEPVADLARGNLGEFRAVWSVGAQQVQAAPWLLVDEGNPFISRPRECEFEQRGQRQTLRLQWARAKRENLLPRLKKAVGVGAAGFGVRKVGDGYWIALQDLMSERALAVVKSVEEQKSILREARFVVLDLRGNGGGSSVLGENIASSLFGDEAAKARLGATAASNCDSTEVFRASKGNFAQLEFLRQAPFVVKGSEEQKKLLDDALTRVRAALAAGRPFSGPLGCQVAPPSTATQPTRSAMRGGLILLTDNACFSSCLAVTDYFRRLGALHVGQTTDAATWYVDVREHYLPSGYSLFSTLQAISGDSKEVGPFEPTLSYDGDIADTAAVEKWITGTVLSRLEPAPPPQPPATP